MSEQSGQDEQDVSLSATISESPPQDPLVGKVVDGRYKIEGRLGEGGMGVVYRASHTTLGKPLAVKVLRPEVSRNDEIVARFKQEAQSASAIGNQHIIDIIDFGALKDGSTYFVMEFLSGHSLTDAMAEERFSQERTIHIAKQLCRALGAAHESGIVHRDMKPDNVQLITRGGDPDFVKVLDFGIAKVGGSTSKLTQAGQVFGTPHYMSPEQCAGTAVDQRTDIYAVGVILYEMGTGQVPFDADNLMGILTKHLYETPVAPHTLPPPTNVSPALEAVILKCLQKKPEVRYQTMGELLEDLLAIEEGRTPGAVTDQVQRTSQMDAAGGDVEGRVSLGVGQPKIPTRSIMPIMLGLLALVLVGTGSYLAMAPSEAAEKPAAAQEVATPEPVAEPEPEPEPEVVEPEVAEEPIASLNLTSTPPGAEVYRDSALLGTTPFSVVKPSGTDSMLLTLKKSGYEDKTVMVQALSPDALAVALTKEKAPVQRPRKTTTRKKRTSSKPKATTKPTNTATKPKAQEPKASGSGRLQSEVIDPWD